jgi:hypothetical protein
MATYKIHPGIGIARLGNSPTEFYLGPETPAGLPQECDDFGNPRFGPDGIAPLLVSTFKDAEGRIKRQAARFQVYVYDADSPLGRPLKLGDTISGGGNEGVLVDIRWRVYLANKKAAWYQFAETAGEHGYNAKTAKRRNPDAGDRSQLIIDPGPRIVNITNKRRAYFDRTGEGAYATTFPPKNLSPNPIDTLGEMVTDNSGHLIVLGGYGNSGTATPDAPNTGDYANHDGWFDDTSDGPVTARLVMFSTEVKRLRYVDVEYPAWVVAGYPRFAPQILDMVTADDVVYDLGLRQFADDTSIYGALDTFDDPQQIDAQNFDQLSHWLASRLTWNRDFHPWFFRDVWPILYRPDEFRWLTDILGQSNYPHDQQQRGTFDPGRLCQPPRYFSTEAQRDQARKNAIPELRQNAAQGEAAFETKADDEGRRPDGRWIFDPYRPMRRFLFDLLRMPGEENAFKVTDRIRSRIYNLPLMPLLCGDNPISNVSPSKFLRLTDYQLFILKQWADGKFIDDRAMHWTPPGYSPFQPYPTTPPQNGRELDRVVLANVLGGAFCPGGEVAWVLRNPSAYWEPYRLKADRSLSDFFQTAAQANSTQTSTAPSGSDIADFTYWVENPLSQNSDFDVGLQPGDFTKYMAVPWQTDFNECTTQSIDITYAQWNVLYTGESGGVKDTRLRKSQKMWETLWWPAHRPVQVFEMIGGNYFQIAWSRGVPQTNAGDIRMATEWSKLPFLEINPALTPANLKEAPDNYPNGAPKFVATERS